MAKTYLELNEVEQLESAAIYLRDKLLVRLLFHLGCRVSEALCLEVKDRGKSVLFCVQVDCLWYLFSNYQGTYTKHILPIN